MVDKGHTKRRDREYHSIRGGAEGHYEGSAPTWADPKARSGGSIALPALPGAPIRSAGSWVPSPTLLGFKHSQIRVLNFLTPYWAIPNDP
jgi:hypothetical protein